MKSTRRIPALALLVCLVVFGAASSGYLQAAPQTLVEKQGRSINAEVLAVSDGKVKIKREDGRVFELPMDALTEETQAALKAWAQQELAKIPDGAINLELSRGMFKVTKQDDGGATISEEEWGYSLTITNRLKRPVDNLRLEYVLFVQPDTEPGKDKTKAALRRTKGSTAVENLATGGRTTLRTDSIKVRKVKLKPGFVWKGVGGADSITDSLYGIWIKAYIGDQVVAEVCTPGLLAKTEKGP